MSGPTAAYMAGVTAHLDVDDGLDVAFGNVPVTIWEESEKQAAKQPRRFPYVQLYKVKRTPAPPGGGCDEAWWVELTAQVWGKPGQRALVRAAVEALAEALLIRFAIAGFRIAQADILEVSDQEDPQSANHVFGGVICRHKIVSTG